jgi:hypothetical protein
MVAFLLASSNAVLAQNRSPQVILDRPATIDTNSVDLFALYAPIYQVGTQGGQDNQMLNQSLAVYGEWQLIDQPGSAGTLYFFFAHEGELLGTSAVEFADSIGTTILANGDVGDAVTAFSYLAWEQKFLEGTIELSVGMLTPGLIVDQNDYAGWDRESFMTLPLSGNPVQNFALAGLGFDLAVNLADDLSIGCLVADADGYPTYPDFKSFGRNFVYIPGLVYKPTIAGWGKGRYEVNFSHTERTERFNPAPSSSALLVSCQQEFRPGLVSVLRYGNGDGRRTDIQQSLAAGLVWTKFLGRDDWFGLGMMWTDPSNGNRADDYCTEAYWRCQVTENIQFTPDIQCYFNPSDRSRRDFEMALSLRIAITL